MNAPFAFDTVSRHVPQSGKWLSLVLTVLMHMVLALLLFFGVQWQRRPPEPITVDLVRSLPPLPRVEVPPQPVVVTPPKPEVQKPEPIPPVKPDIAIKTPKPEPVKPKKEPVKPPPEPEQTKPPEKVKAVEKPKTIEKTPVPETPPLSDKARMEQLMKMDADRARLQTQANDNAIHKANADEAARSTRANDEWGARIRSKVRRNLVLPPTGITGRPRAEFDIQLLPTGEVLNIQLIRSSGNKALDDAIERAISKSNPLPLPANQELFQRELNLIFDPLGD